MAFLGDVWNQNWTVWRNRIIKEKPHEKTSLSKQKMSFMRRNLSTNENIIKIIWTTYSFHLCKQEKVHEKISLSKRRTHYSTNQNLIT